MVLYLNDFTFRHPALENAMLSSASVSIESCVPLVSAFLQSLLYTVPLVVCFCFPRLSSLFCVVLVLSSFDNTIIGLNKPPLRVLLTASDLV